MAKQKPMVEMDGSLNPKMQYFLRFTCDYFKGFQAHSVLSNFVKKLNSINTQHLNSRKATKIPN